MNGTYILVRDKGRLVRADYAGGAYIDLTFGSAAYQPTEVINVYDYAVGATTIHYTNDAVRAEVKAWMAANDVEWPTWYADYLKNAR